MNNFLDDDSKNLIINAKKEMYNLKHPYVGTEHLLLAILNKKDLCITKLLEKFGINYDKFKKKLIDSVGVGSNYSNWYLFTPLLKDVINNSLSVSGKNMVSPKDLIISILEQGDGVANRILLCMNIDIKYLCHKINSLYGEFCGVN